MMNMLIDSAHIPEIERLLDSFPAGGVTTNPALIAREKQPFKQQIQDIRRLLPEHLPLHAQVIADQWRDMVDQAKALYNWLDGNVSVKIPVTAQGLYAIRKLRLKTSRPQGQRFIPLHRLYWRQKPAPPMSRRMSIVLIKSMVMGRALSKRLSAY